MSATESKVKTAPKTSKKTLKSAEAEALKVALDAAQVEYVPVSALVKSPLNVRTIPYPAEKVCSMADSIEAIGLPYLLLHGSIGKYQFPGMLFPFSAFH